MDNFLKTPQGFSTTLKLIETINHSTDDYLFIWNIKEDARWFFGDIDTHYDIRKNGSETNSTAEMLRIIHPADSEAVLESLRQIANGEKDTHNMNYRWINRRGEKVWINCHGTVIRDEENKPHLMIGRVSEENLRHLYNPLTGLWNKNKLRQDLKERLKKSGYLLLLDIDSLATINLTHGRAYGDTLLKDIAALCEKIDVVETAYHTDHNYFALVLNVSTEEAVRAVFMKIKDEMAERCTVTVAAAPIDNTLFRDETQLLDSANMTLKKAKNISGNRIEFFSFEDLSHNISSMELLEELKQSVENGCRGFEVYYQPQICAGTYEIYGVEALLRYQSPTRGRVFPDEFIPLLEDSRLIKDVGLWVLKQAVRQCKQWQEFLPSLHVSVNFSVLQFEDEDLADKVIRCVKAAQLSGESLTVEITETIGLRNSEKLMDTIQKLKAYRINFAIDDFGTGYANLGYLKQMEVDEIKIDRVFVSDIEKGTYNHKLVSNVIEFAKENDIRACCEGVENAHELITLESLLPDIMQGYLFDKPCTAEQIESTYVHAHSKEYKQRLLFLEKLRELKEKMGVVHFDPKGILRENEIGLWMMRIHPTQRHNELHVDETMQRLLGIDPQSSPAERYEYWASRIHPAYAAYVKDSLDTMITGDKSVQMEYIWCHANGDIPVRFSGKRVDDSDGMILLEGYYRHITEIAGQKETEK